jgi:hypothetical protein
MAIIKSIAKLAPGRPHKIPEVHCNDWKGLIRVFDRLGNNSTRPRVSESRWIFRGHADATWQLESTIERAFKDSWRNRKETWLWNKATVLKHLEGQLAFDFASKAQLYGLSVSLEKPVELLSAMRHFGTPTRLIDWTYSPFVALYFAFEQQHHAKEAAVWALDVAALHRAATVKVLPVEKLAEGSRLRPPIRYIDFSRDDVFQEHVLPDLDSYHRSELLGEPTLEIVVPLLPRAQNERISAQQGLFICASQLGSSVMAQTQKLMRGARTEWVRKIVIPRTLRQEALRRLFQMNVHPLSLFPGPDGLGQFAKQKAELFGWE